MQSQPNRRMIVVAYKLETRIPNCIGSLSSWSGSGGDTTRDRRNNRKLTQDEELYDQFYVMLEQCGIYKKTCFQTQMMLMKTSFIQPTYLTNIKYTNNENCNIDEKGTFLPVGV